MRTIERLADIDVAKSRHHALVEQRCLQTGFLVVTGARQHRGVEFIAERLRAQALQQRLILHLMAGNDLHVTETARIVEDNRGARGHVKHDVVVGTVLIARVMEFARRHLAVPLQHPE